MTDQNFTCVTLLKDGNVKINRFFYEKNAKEYAESILVFDHIVSVTGFSGITAIFKVENNATA